VPIKIKLSDEFATIDFERTSDFGANAEWTQIRDRVNTMEKLDEVEVNGERFLLFKQGPFRPLKHLPDHDVVSSLVKMQDEVKQWRAIGIAIVVAFVSLGLTLLNFQANLYSQQKATSQQVFELERDLGIAKNELQTLKAQVPDHPSVPGVPPAAGATMPRSNR
jgi:hypothetical protein